jgi:SAM-dependent methyltransferase
MQIPQGNTSAQVNRQVFRNIEALLSSSNTQSKQLQILDAPCGQAEWIGFLQSQFSQHNYFGADVHEKLESHDLQKKINYQRCDLTKEFLPEKNFDLVTSISGLVCFGNHLHFFRSIYKSLKPGGVLILTNDNHWTLRDRFQFLFSGHFKRFPLMYGDEQGNSQSSSLMTVMHGLSQAQYKIIDVQYMSIRAEDWLWLPLASLVWIFQWPKIIFSREKKNRPSPRKIFPFKALLARHWLISARRPN